MKYLKLLVLPILIMVMAVGLTACGGGNNRSGGEDFDWVTPRKLQRAIEDFKNKSIFSVSVEGEAQSGSFKTMIERNHEKYFSNNNGYISIYVLNGSTIQNYYKSASATAFSYWLVDDAMKNQYENRESEYKTVVQQLANLFDVDYVRDEWGTAIFDVPPRPYPNDQNDVTWHKQGNTLTITGQKLNLLKPSIWNNYLESTLGMPTPKSGGANELPYITNFTLTLTTTPHFDVTKKTFSFNMGGASGTIPAQQLYFWEAPIAPAQPSRQFHHFDGWYTSATYTTPINFSHNITANTTAYAKWREYTHNEIMAEIAGQYKVIALTDRVSGVTSNVLGNTEIVLTFNQDGTMVHGGVGLWLITINGMSNDTWTYENGQMIFIDSTPTSGLDTSMPATFTKLTNGNIQLVFNMGGGVTRTATLERA